MNLKSQLEQRWDTIGCSKTTQEIRNKKLKGVVLVLRKDVLAFVNGYTGNTDDWIWFHSTIAFNLKDRLLIIRGLKDVKALSIFSGLYDNYVFIDTGYMGNNKSPVNKRAGLIYKRVVYNALQDTVIKKHVSRDRFDLLHEKINKWRTGHSILLCPPSPKSLLTLDGNGLKDFSLICKEKGFTFDSFKLPGKLDKQYHQQFNGKRNKKSTKLSSVRVGEPEPLELYQKKWTYDIIKELRLYTKRPIIIRGKPQSRRTRLNTGNTFQEAVRRDIWATVTYNSIVAVESILEGVPAFVVYENAAADVASSDLSQIENPFKPDINKRIKWASYLAYNQFTQKEMEDGTAYKIQSMINKL